MTKLQYKGRNIEIVESPDPKISIDGEEIEVRYDIEAGAFNSGWLPYQTFLPPTILAEEIAERFFTGEDNED